MNKFCIYQHIRLDTNKVFYIGIGDIKRPYSKYQRNIYWKNITNKTDYEIQILKSDLCWEEACELEVILISYFGRKDLNEGLLCNMTDGGDGCKNLKHSKLSKSKMSKSHKGKKLSKESILKRTEKQYKQIIDLNSLIIYKNIDELLLTFYNIKKRNLQNQLNGTTVNYSNFRYLKDYQNNILIKKENKRKKKVIDYSTNIIYESMLEVSIKFKIPLSTLNKYLKNIIKNKTNFLFYETKDNS